MSAHTAGPWDVSQYTHEGYPQTYVRGADGMNVADAGHRGDSSIVLANAKLIAAAPDLAEALHAILELYGHELNHSNVGKAGRAALAKAGL